MNDQPDIERDSEVDPEAVTEISPGPGGASLGDATERPLPKAIGRYRILGKLGEGGMGVVYEAEQSNPRRRVAVKIVRGGQFVDDLYLRMFQREADTLARLKHPNIGAIYETGCTEDGQHFFAMELVRGETLSEHLRDRPAPTTRVELQHRLALFRKIADAVHYAHQRGVIHRDLKPANILVNDKALGGGSSATFQVPDVKILDFGLARITDGDLRATISTGVGELRGTLPYMSPEQARGDSDDIDVRSDVYALGVLLYEMITGRLPYDLKTTIVNAVNVICETPPDPMRSGVLRKLNPDVETIIGKALEKESERRYGSAAALSDDVLRYLMAQPIQARPPSTWYQLRKLIARNRSAAAIAFSAALIFVVGIASFFVYQQRKNYEISRRLYASEMARAGTTMQENYGQGVRAILDAMPVEFRQWEWRRLDSLTRDRTLGTFGYPESRAHELAVDPKGSRMVTAHADGKLRFWRIATGECLATWEAHDDKVVSVDWSDDGRWILSGGYDSKAHLWSAATGQRIRTVEALRRTDNGEPCDIVEVAISSDAKRFAVLDFRDQYCVRVFDLESGEELTRAPRASYFALEFTPDGRGVSGAKAEIVILDSKGGEERTRMKGHQWDTSCIAFDPTGRLLVSGGLHEHVVRVWSVARGEAVHELKGHKDGTRAVAFSADGHLIASANADQTVRLWDTRSGELLASLAGHEGGVFDVDFIPGLEEMITIAGDGSFRRWPTAPLDVDLTLEVQGKPLTDVEFNPDGTRVAVAGYASSLCYQFDARTGAPLSAFVQRFARSLAYRPPYGDQLALACDDFFLRVFDANSGTRTDAALSHGGYVRELAYSADGSRVVTQSYDKKARLWDADTGDLLRIWELDLTDYPAAAISGDGSTVVLGGAPSVGLQVWGGGDAPLWEEPGLELRCATFAPGDREIAAGSKSGSIYIWSTVGPKSRREFRSYAGPVNALVYSRDGTRIFAGYGDGSIKVWSHDGDELLGLSGHDGAVNALDISPDGDTLASVGDDATLRFWSSQVNEDYLEQRRAVTRARSQVERLIAEGRKPMEVFDKFWKHESLPEDVRQAGMQMARNIALVHALELSMSSIEMAPGAEAVPKLTAATERLEPLIGPAHPEVRALRSALGTALIKINNLERAERVLREAAKYGSDPSVFGNLGWLLLKLDRPADAEAVLRQSLETPSQASTGDLWARVKVILGQALLEQKKTEEAETWLLEAYESAPPWGQKVRDSAAELLIKLYDSSGQRQKAKEWSETTTG